MKLPIDERCCASLQLPHEEAFVKRIAFLICALVLLITACAPSLSVETNVQPTLFSVTIRESDVLLQGRYFGDGRGGQSENSYVILGADVNGAGGVMVRPNVWSANRIEVGIPNGAGYGYVFVVVNGVRSNGLPASLP